ncbi:MAG TPA: polyketide synthase, partial [Thermoanaerobaculia bacterium]|nr:polyketide synthase [Thermoanaerobaculia bacterium]
MRLDPPSRPVQLLILSAETATALEAAAQQLADRLEAQPELELAEVAWTLQSGGKAFEHRRIAVARDSQQAIAALRGPAIAGHRETPEPRPVVFLFPGLGDQRVDMARELYETVPFFREVMDECAGKLAPRLGANLREVLFSPGEWRPAVAAKPDLRALLRRGPQQTSRLDQTLFA